MRGWESLAPQARVEESVKQEHLPGLKSTCWVIPVADTLDLFAGNVNRRENAAQQDKSLSLTLLTSCVNDCQVRSWLSLRLCAC